MPIYSHPNLSSAVAHTSTQYYVNNTGIVNAVPVNNVCATQMSNVQQPVSVSNEVLKRSTVAVSSESSSAALQESLTSTSECADDATVETSNGNELLVECNSISDQISTNTPSNTVKCLTSIPAELCKDTD